MSNCNDFGSQRGLPEGSPELIRDKTRETLEAFKNCNFILDPSQGIEDDIPAAHVVAMFDEAKLFYRYTKHH